MVPCCGGSIGSLAGMAPDAMGQKSTHPTSQWDEWPITFEQATTFHMFRASAFSLAAGYTQAAQQARMQHCVARRWRLVTVISCCIKCRFTLITLRNTSVFMNIYICSDITKHNFSCKKTHNGTNWFSVVACAGILLYAPLLNSSWSQPKWNCNRSSAPV